MNQIICSPYCTIDRIENHIKHDKKSSFVRIHLLFFFGITFSTLAYYCYFRYDLYSQEKIAKELKNSFEITKIYENSSNYSAERLSSEEVFFYEGDSFSVIGSIDIKKINISYPILSDISKEFLRISPCRFYGPMPNEIR